MPNEKNFYSKDYRAVRYELALSFLNNHAIYLA